MNSISRALSPHTYTWYAIHLCLVSHFGTRSTPLSVQNNAEASSLFTSLLKESIDWRVSFIPSISFYSKAAESRPDVTRLQSRRNHTYCDTLSNLNSRAEKIPELQVGLGFTCQVQGGRVAPLSVSAVYIFGTAEFLNTSQAAFLGSVQ